MSYQEKVFSHKYNPPIKIKSGIRMFIISTAYLRRSPFISIPPEPVVLSDTLLMKSDGKNRLLIL